MADGPYRGIQPGLKEMRYLLPTAFILGLMFKVLHLPYHTVFLLLVLSAAFIRAVVLLIRGPNKTKAWVRLSIWAWATHLVALLKLFPFRSATLIIAIGICIISVYHLIRQRPVVIASARILAGTCILIMLIMAVPTSKRFHFTNLAFSLERGTDARSWDKYSFFLAREGHLAKALDANTKAVEAARTNGEPELFEPLAMRREAIEGRTWTHFKGLPHSYPGATAVHANGTGPDGSDR